MTAAYYCLCNEERVAWSKFDIVPSLTPEGPAGVGRGIGEEIFRIRCASSVLLRQLQKTPSRQAPTHG